MQGVILYLAGGDIIISKDHPGSVWLMAYWGPREEAKRLEKNCSRLGEN